MATTISSGTNPYKLGSPPDFGTLYSGRALDFDGVTDYVDCGAITITTNHTITAWVNPVVDGNNKVIFDSRDSNNDGVLVWVTSAEKIEYQINGEDLITTPTYGGSWVHIAVTYDGTTQKLYIDGVLAQSSAETETISVSSTAYIGARSHTSRSNYFSGKITNVQLWDTAWSLSDVQYAYTHPEKLITDNSAVTSGTTISNLKAWYPCTEGNPRSPQTTVYDGSPKGLWSEIIIGQSLAVSKVPLVAISLPNS